MAWDDEIPTWSYHVTQALLEALKERDPYTYGHCRRVGRHARLLAKAAGLGPREQKIVEYGSLFHDLGKIGIADSVLFKPGRLTPEEELIMQEHPIKSAEIITPLSHVPFFDAMIPGIRHHHERIDGRGYPDRISGSQIPLVSRLIIIADTYDAMTTTRPYRKGLPAEVAYKELQTFAGRQFDPHLVKIFVKAHPLWGAMEEEITEEFVSSRFRRAA